MAVVAGPSNAAKRLEEEWGVVFGRLPGFTGCWCLAGLLDDSRSGGDGGGRAALPTKVMATGVSVKRWVTMHGLALNCDCGLAWAQPPHTPHTPPRGCAPLAPPIVAATAAGVGGIIPCGIKNLPVGTLSEVALAAWERRQRRGGDSLGDTSTPPGPLPLPSPSVGVAQARAHVVAAFADVFGCSCDEGQ